MKKISIIIPVHNIEAFLPDCMESVISQSYKNIEIICIDDASSDNSYEILQSYAKKDDRIVLLKNEKNIYLGPTRNKGILKASGDYVLFLDGDDYLEDNALLNLASIIENNNPDLVFFGYRDVNYKTKEKIKEYNNLPSDTINKTIELDSKDKPKMFWLEQVWNKLYSIEFIKKHNLLNNDYPIHEDMEYSFLTRFLVKTIYYTNDIIINYRTKNPTSLMGKHLNYTEWIFKSLEFEYDYIKNHNMDFELAKFFLYYGFKMFYLQTTDAYVENYISYEVLKSRVEKVYNMLLEYNIDYGYKKCSEIINSRFEFYLKVKLFLRKYKRTRLLIFKAFLKKIKNKIIK